jgi:DNA-binding transcriptional LysR family regulator
MSTELSLAEGGTSRWLGIEFRHFSALAAVAREGSFRRAAEKLGYVQSAVSSQIGQLEQAVGTQLIERSSGSPGAALTGAGVALLAHTDEILARLDAARIDLQALADGAVNDVRLAVSDGLAQPQLTKSLAAFNAEYPESGVRIDESEDDDLSFARLARGEIDLLITELPIAPGPFEHRLLERDTYVLLVPADSPLATTDEAPTGVQLRRLPLILPAPSRRHDPLAQRLQESLIDQTPWLRPSDAAATQALVGASLGIAVLPHSAVNLDDPCTVQIPIPGVLPDRHIALVRHREREYASNVTRFISILEATFAQAS